MSQANQRFYTRKSVETIMSKRSRIEAIHEGEYVKLTIRGNGTRFEPKKKDGTFAMSAVDAGVVFAVIIFNVESNSSIALGNPANKELSKQALMAETAGNKEEAHKLYQEFLNKVQVSFSVPETNPIVKMLGDRVRIEGRVQVIRTENGSLISIDPSTIRVLEGVTLSSTAFSFDADEVFGGEGSDAPKVDELNPTPTGEAEPTELELEKAQEAKHEVGAEAAPIEA